MRKKSQFFAVDAMFASILVLLGLTLAFSFFIEEKFLTFTGVSFYPLLKTFTSRLLDREKLKTIDVACVENTFFGTSVTVAGLLTGRDVIRTLLDTIEGHEIVLVPDVVLNEENKFLDDIALDDMEEALGIPVKKIDSTPEGLVKGIVEGAQHNSPEERNIDR